MYIKTLDSSHNIKKIIYMTEYLQVPKYRVTEIRWNFRSEMNNIRADRFTLGLHKKEVSMTL